MSIFQKLGGTGMAPWEIGRVQPTVVKLVQQGVFTGDILDVGCGDCNNAIYLAKATGLKVTAFDLVPRAVEDARERITKAGANVDVFQADVFHLHSTPIASKRFDTVLDAAVFHFFHDGKRLAYRDILAKLVKPGGLYLMLVISSKCVVDFPKGYPRKLTPGEIEGLFRKETGWHVEDVEDSVYQLLPEGGSTALQDLPAYLARVRRLQESKL